jgi:hypothetical protein
MQGVGRNRRAFFYFPSTEAIAAFYDSRETDDLQLPLSIANRKCERELIAFGYRISHYLVDEFQGHARQWLKSGLPPDAVLMHHLKSAGDTRLIATIERLLQRFGPETIRFLFNSEKGSHMLDIPKNICRIALGRHLTIHARTLAREIASRGYNSVGVFFDAASIHSQTSKLGFVRLFDEFFQCRPGGAVSIWICQSRGNAHAFIGNNERRVMDERCAKSSVLKNFVFDEHVHYKPSISAVVQEAAENERQAMVCLNSAEAQSVLHAARELSIRVPDRLGIVSLVEDASCCIHKISSCMADWEAIGYLNAHALIGDIPVKRSSRGFIDSRALMYDRGTL